MAGDRGQIIFIIIIFYFIFYDSGGIESSLDFQLPANIQTIYHTWNPQNAEWKKWKLFSCILTGAFSFPSLEAFFPWLKVFPAEQVSAAYTVPDILCEHPASLSL